MCESECHGRPAPILLGIVGHTALRPGDHAALSAAMRTILEDLRRRYPSRPLTVVSSLAEGADQLCADVALEAGIAVIAPLPFPAELYRSRFKSPAARHHLDRLVRHPAVKAFCPVANAGAAPDFAALLADDQQRRQRYADAAIFVARHSHALIAVWDGRDEANPSLTAQLVGFKTLGRPFTGPVHSSAPPEPGMVFSIFAPRAGTATDATQPPGQVEILPRSTSRTVSREELFRATFESPRACTPLALLLPWSTPS